MSPYTFTDMEPPLTAASLSGYGSWQPGAQTANSALCDHPVGEVTEFHAEVDEEMDSDIWAQPAALRPRFTRLMVATAPGGPPSSPPGSLTEVTYDSYISDAQLPRQDWRGKWNWWPLMMTVGVVSLIIMSRRRVSAAAQPCAPASQII